VLLSGISVNASGSFWNVRVILYNCLVMTYDIMNFLFSFVICVCLDSLLLLSSHVSWAAAPVPGSSDSGMLIGWANRPPWPDLVCCGFWPNKSWLGLSTSQSYVDFFQGWQFDLFVLDPWGHLISQISQYSPSVKLRFLIYYLFSQFSHPCPVLRIVWFRNTRPV
jgi:hypothetical protein